MNDDAGLGHEMATDSTATSQFEPSWAEWTEFASESLRSGLVGFERFAIYSFRWEEGSAEPRI